MTFLKINEIFLSIQGEGIDQGEPCIFVRTFGCNNQCKYCDSKYATSGKDFTQMSVDEVIEKVKSLGYNNVCITGGEPLLHKKAIIELCQKLGSQYTIWIETNGTQNIGQFMDEMSEDYGDISFVNIVMDIKGPSSGMADKTNWDNLAYLTEDDQVKFVVGTEEDYQFAKNKINVITPFSCVKCLISPAFDCDNFKVKLTPTKIVEKMLADKLPARFSLQLHKIVWNPNKRAV